MEDDDDEDEDGDSLRCGNDGAWTAAGNNNQTKLQRTRDPEKKMHELFQEIDVDKDGLLSRYHYPLHPLLR
jgi:hypothetical protein